MPYINLESLLHEYILDWYLQQSAVSSELHRIIPVLSTMMINLSVQPLSCISVLYADVCVRVYRTSRVSR